MGLHIPDLGCSDQLPALSMHNSLAGMPGQNGERTLDGLQLLDTK